MALKTHTYERGGITVYDDTKPIKFALCLVDGDSLIALEFRADGHPMHLSPGNRAVFGEDTVGKSYRNYLTRQIDLLELVAIFHRIQAGEEDYHTWKD